MKYLIDTHTLIWAITDKSKLSTNVVRALEDPDNTILVSAVCFWEIALKFSLGKLGLSGATPDEIPVLAQKTGFQLLDLTAIETCTYHELTATHHKDPFDRMLIWQAICQNLILISKDENVSKYISEGLKVLW